MTAEVLVQHEEEPTSDQQGVPVLSLTPTNDSENAEQNPFNVLWKQSKPFLAVFPNLFFHVS